MKFKIIPNEHTPKVLAIESSHNFIGVNKKLLEKFLSFARRQHNCAGLAANQVSVNGERIMLSFFAIKDNHFWDIIIDPKITNYSGKKQEMVEGCLTWLGKKLKASRHPVIRVNYYNLKGEFINKSVDGFYAQIFQHEYNHLMGIEENIII